MLHPSFGAALEGEKVQLASKEASKQGLVSFGLLVETLFMVVLVTSKTEDG